jgi:hypothetical protein
MVKDQKPETKNQKLFGTDGLNILNRYCFYPVESLDSNFNERFLKKEK